MSPSLLLSCHVTKLEGSLLLLSLFPFLEKGALERSAGSDRELFLDPGGVILGKGGVLYILILLSEMVGETVEEGREQMIRYDMIVGNKEIKKKEKK